MSFWPGAVGKPNLRNETVLLGHFEERHGTGQRFATAVRTLQEPVLPPDAEGSVARSATLWSIPTRPSSRNDSKMAS